MSYDVVAVYQTPIPGPHVVLDGPAGGVPLTVQLINDWLREYPHGRIERLATGGLVLDAGLGGVREVVGPWAGGGCPVAGEDGAFPTVWESADQALYMAGLRQRLRRRVAPDGHWRGRISKPPADDRRRGQRRSQITVDGRWFAAFGYSPRRGISMWGHRASFIAFYGRAPVGGTVDHQCKEASCMRPDHLGDATAEENQAREHVGAGYGVVRRARKAVKRAAGYRTVSPGAPDVVPAPAGMDEALAALAERFGPERRRSSTVD